MSGITDADYGDRAGAAAAAQAASQPVDSDLTAIAALSTTAYGRSFLALADAAAARTLTGALDAAQKGAASGVAPLDAASLVPWANVPDVTGSVVEGGVVTMRRSDVASALPVTTTQTFRLSYFTAHASLTSTQVRAISGSTAAAATPTLVRIGLYSIAADGVGTLAASIANDTTLFAATNTRYTRSWTSPVAVTAGQRYAIGILVVTAVASPTLAGIVVLASMTAEYSAAPRRSGGLAGQTDLPASFTDASLGTSSGLHYAVVLP